MALFRAAIAAASISIAAACAGGSSGDPPVEQTEYFEDCSAALPGRPAASDEAFRAFVEAEVAGRRILRSTKAPRLTLPAVGATLDPTKPPEIRFDPTHGSLSKLGPVDRAAQPGCSRLDSSAPASLWALALSIAHGLIEGTAEAHCAAVSGELYLLRINDGVRTRYTALLSVTAFTPGLSAWTAAMNGAAGKTLSLTVERAVFFKGSIMDGPFVQETPYTFEAPR